MEILYSIVKVIFIISVCMVFVDIGLYIAVKKKDKKKNIINGDFKEVSDPQNEQKCESSLKN